MQDIIKNSIKNVVVASMTLMVFSAAFFVFDVGYVLADADALLTGGTDNAVQEATGLGNEDIRIVVAKVINIFLGFLGIIAVSLIIYAGWLWTTSAGDVGKIDLAKKTLTSSMVGLVIVLSSFGIAQFIINALYGVSDPAGPVAIAPGISGFGSGAAGNGVIESHYPAAGQGGVARNTSIMVSFKEAMDPSTIILDTNGTGTYGDWVDSNANTFMDDGEYDRVATSSVALVKTADLGVGPEVEDLFVAVSSDNKNYSFKQVGFYIGSPSEVTFYSVQLSSDIQKVAGGSAFPGAGGGYVWNFDVSTIIDITPPRIISVIPLPATSEARNVVVQINFSEAIDPFSAAGSTLDGFDNLVVRNDTDSVDVAGNFYVSNQYRTIEFLTEDVCGTNSCEQQVYCLPANKQLSTLVKAATLASLSETFGSYPYDGVVDMAANSLDGNSDGLTQGPQAQSGMPAYNENAPSPTTQGDDYTWSFNTTDEIDISAPIMESISPNSGSTNVGLGTNIEVVFNKYLMKSSLVRDVPAGTGSYSLFANPVSSEVGYWYGVEDDIFTKKSKVIIMHRPFMESSDYVPQFNSTVLDIYQNCYRPSEGPSCTPNIPGGLPYCCDGVQSATSCMP